MQTFSRCGVALFLVAVVAGCSSSGPTRGAPSAYAGPDRASVRQDDCRRNRSGCIYEGAYEPGERDYAEQEAKRLNRASAVRMRSFGR